MNVEELRVGNIIKTLQGVGRVEQIRHTGKHGYGIVLEDELAGSYIEYCEGIPLAEEVLLKCGFEKESGRYWLGGYPSGFSISDKFDDINMINPIYELKVSYLHELQNIVKVLTGKELEYEKD